MKVRKTSVTARELAKSKAASATAKMELMGDYNHALQRRWVGEDTSMIAWSMKSDTSFDRESSDPD